MQECKNYWYDIKFTRQLNYQITKLKEYFSLLYLNEVTSYENNFIEIMNFSIRNLKKKIIGDFARNM